jgi:hypothetical protein
MLRPPTMTLHRCGTYIAGSIVDPDVEEWTTWRRAEALKVD